jgi:hypothetical protein
VKKLYGVNPSKQHREHYPPVDVIPVAVKVNRDADISTFAYRNVLIFLSSSEGRRRFGVGSRWQQVAQPR